MTTSQGSEAEPPLDPEHVPAPTEGADAADGKLVDSQSPEAELPPAAPPVVYRRLLRRLPWWRFGSSTGRQFKVQ